MHPSVGLDSRIVKPRLLIEGAASFAQASGSIKRNPSVMSVGVDSRGVKFGHFSHPVQSEVQCKPKMLSENYPKKFGFQKLFKFLSLLITFINCYRHACATEIQKETHNWQCYIDHWIVLHNPTGWNNAWNLLCLMACPRIVQVNIGWPNKVRIGFGHFRRSNILGLRFTPLVDSKIAS